MNWSRTDISGGSVLSAPTYSRYVMGISSSRNRAYFDTLAFIQVEGEGNWNRNKSCSLWGWEQ